MTQRDILIPTSITSANPSTPVQAPQLLSPEMLALVSGGSPKGGWEIEPSDPQSPKGGW